MYVLYVIFVLIARVFSTQSDVEFHVCTFTNDAHNYEFLSVESNPYCDGTTGVAYAWIDHSTGRYASCVQWRFTTGDYYCDAFIASEAPDANGTQYDVHQYHAPMISIDAQVWLE